MLDGGQFVEALGRLGYPGASSLKASDFDWMFDCAPENLHFLRFVCRTLNSSNVLTLEEARAFQALRQSGKAILDEAPLGEVLKTIAPSEGGSSSSPSSSMFREEGEVTTDDLEAELQALRKEKELKQRRYNRLQVLATSRADVDLRLSAELESAAGKLKEAGASVGAENAHTNTVLQNLTDEVKNLASYLPIKQDDGNRAEASRSKPAVLLSQLSLDPYLQQEELNTKTLAAFTHKQFFRGISDIVQTSCSSQRLQLLDLTSYEAGEKEDNKEEADPSEERSVERRRTEVARLQWAHIVAQHQLMQAKAEEKSVTAGLDWLAEKAAHIKSISTSSKLHIRKTVLKKELQAVEEELEALLQGPVPASLRESARQVNVPVVSGDLDLQLARKDYYTCRQDQIRDYLLRQKASFDLVLLAEQMELRRWGMCLKQLEEISSRLVEEEEAASLRIGTLAHPDLALNPRPNPIISCKDAAFSRLLQILDHRSDRGRSEPFQTYKALDQASSDLAADLRATGDALAGVSQEQRYTAARFSGDCAALHRTMYTELQELVLGPQVCPMTTSNEERLCPNAQEVSTKLLEAESQLQNLQKLMQEIMGDIKAKHSLLDRNNLLKKERKLYVYYHLDGRLLQKTVEELEVKMTGKSGQR